MVGLHRNRKETPTRPIYHTYVIRHNTGTSFRVIVHGVFDIIMFYNIP